MRPAWLRPQHFRSLAGFVSTACLSISASYGQPLTGPAKGGEKLRNDGEIVRPFSEGDRFTKVIVQIQPPAQQKRMEQRQEWDSPAALKVLHAETRGASEAVLSRLPAATARIRDRYENFAGFSAEVTTEGLARLMADPDVVTIEPDVAFEPACDAQGLAVMNALSPQSSTLGAGVSVAIVDTGVDYTHPRLGGGGFPNSKVIGGYDTGDDDANPFPPSNATSSAAAHGTCCAGIVAGTMGSTGDYVGGVAPGAKIYALKIMNSAGVQNTSDIVQAWDWIVSHKNDDPNNPILVASNSFSGGQFGSVCDSTYPAMLTSLTNMTNAGISVFISSGNDGMCNSIGAPACVTGAIAVGAVYDANIGSVTFCVNSGACGAFSHNGCASGFAKTDNPTAADMVTCYSNSSSQLALLAPSNNCYAPDVAGSAGYAAGDYTSTFGGTSAACPYAAGAAAALQAASKQKNGSFLTPAQVRATLASTGDSITDTKVARTTPRVNLGRALGEDAPANDDFANRIAVSGNTATMTGHNRSATSEANEPNPFSNGSYTVTPQKSVWWKYTPTAAGSVTISTAGSNNGGFDTVLAVYTGSSLGSLVKVAQDDDGNPAGGSGSLVTFPATAGTEYQIVVDGYHAGAGIAAEGDVTLSVTLVAPTAPLIETSPSSLVYSTPQGASPASQTLMVRNGAAESGAMNYNITVSYQGGQPTGWISSISPSSGTSTATGASVGPWNNHAVNISSSGLAAGTYNATISITASGAGNTPQTVPVTLTVTGVDNDMFANRRLLSGSNASDTGTNVGATAEAGEPETQPDSAPGKTVWWKWTAPANGTMSVNTMGSSFDTVLAIHTGSSVAGLTRRINDDDGGGHRTSLISNYPVTAGTEYQIAVDGYSNNGVGHASGSVKIQLIFNPAGTPLPSIAAGPTVLNFSALTGGTNPVSQALSISNGTAGSGKLDYILDWYYQGLPATDWLTVVPTSGSSTAGSSSGGPSAGHTVTANVAGLAPGTYGAYITIISANSANSGVTVQVVLTVHSPSTAYQPLAHDTFPNATGWAPTGANAGTYGVYHNAANTALYTQIAPGASDRIIGWLENQAAGDAVSDHLRFSEITPSQFVRAKFHVFAGGQPDPANKNQVPNMRLRVSSRFAFASVLEVAHHNIDIEATSYSQDLTPSQNPAAPSVYRVDMDPPELPYLQGNTTEGLQRMFEVYSTALEPQARGILALTESSIGVYPAPNTTTMDPSVLVKTYSSATDFSRHYYDLRQYARGSLTLKAMNINGNNAGGNVNGATWTGIPSNQVTVSSGAGGITLSTGATPDTLLATAAVDWLDGTAEDANHALRARVEPQKQYVIQFRASATGASSNNALLRFRARTVKFNYTQRLEVGGAWNLATNATRNASLPSHILAREYLPGTGGWASGVYNVVMVSPLVADIRADVSGTIAQRMPNLNGQDGPGQGPASRTTASRRDLLPGLDIIDSLSGSYYLAGSSDPAEKGNVTVSRIEIRQYDLVPD